MGFEAQETSRAAGEPAELYRFIYGPNGESYCYTDAEEEIVVSGIGPSGGDLTFLPVPISRSDIGSSGTLDKAALTVSTSIDTEIAELFRVYPPPQVVGLIIRQGHLNDPDEQWLVSWTGRVLSGSRKEGSVVELTCESAQTSMRRAALRRHYQYGCPYALYQGVDGKPGCHASKAAATEEGTVASINGTDLTLDAGWNGTRDAAKFLRGTVEWDTTNGREVRTILRVAGNTLTLGGLIRDLEVDDTVDVVLGCNRQMDDCKELHDVLQDFGGQPWIPTRNPVGQANNFY